MSGEKKLFVSEPTYRIYQPHDLGKKWFVEWFEGAKRCRKYGDINQGKTAKERLKRAEKLLVEIKASHKRKVSRLESAVFKNLKANDNVWRQKTKEQYHSIARVFFDWLDGRKFTLTELKAFLQQVKSTRHPSTYNKYLTSLKRMLGAVGYEHYFTDLDKMKSHPTPARYFQSYQANRLGKVIEEQDPELWLFVQFIYYCFIRPNELRRLKVGDILLDEQEIRVMGENSKNKQTQFVVIPDIFIDKLEFLYDEDPGRYLFPGVNPAKPVGRETMYRKHKKILDAMNFGQGYSLYSWKHTGAVAVAKAGISIKELQLQLRHHSLDQTDQYLRQMGVRDIQSLKASFPNIRSKLKRLSGSRRPYRAGTAGHEDQ